MNTAATHPDPFQALGEALQAVIEDAVAKALASVKTASSEDAVMLSVPEAAERLGVGTTKVKQLIASGQLGLTACLIERRECSSSRRESRAGAREGRPVRRR